ncbi:F-box At1g78280-like, partial [Paramuricea clavata]
PYNWTGTNAVFYGKKLWKLYPPGQDEYLYVMPDKKSEFPLNCYKYNSPIDAYNPDLKKYPKFSKARAISFEQRPGELLIIPPGWFHQAFNAVETIAVSSQVMNSQNYHIILEEIFKAGNIDRKILPSDFYQRAPIEQVMFVSNSLPSEVLQRGREVTKDILQQMGYPTK